MQTIELFSGTESFSGVARRFRHQTFTVDNDNSFNPDLCEDIRHIRVGDLPCRPDILWASPPCEGFSVAVIGRNWHRDGRPKTERARTALALVVRTLALIAATGPTWWFIENPRGMLRKMPFMQGLTRHTVTYCQYGDTRMKPTDIWTNAGWWKPKPPCKNGDACHQAAPRGSKTGTQGIALAKDRSRIPLALFEEMFAQLQAANDNRRAA
ncbi:DNA cytosine methyltransferase [Methylocystis sp. WRRC1]|uniref:DNA cytosine methyltransferase n=1 Tax=Methylocystis sp. WRRC1 TaxID=1732014 RepID=UPI001D1527BC|nr:DNA cytosine methyltransferase [Methylocystis sp. WRRC1]MCC3246428.1 DNA cytosine methyltransferase [Methylocystis sp. WRRC1]